MSELEEIRDAVRRIEARQAEILELLNELQPRRRPSQDDAEFLDRLLRTLAARIGSNTFQVRDLMQDPVFRELLGNLNAHQVGQVLSRATRFDVAGLRVKPLKAEGGSMLWSVVAVVSEPPQSPEALESTRAVCDK
jgi:hypothetical protein